MCLFLPRVLVGSYGYFPSFWLAVVITLVLISFWFYDTQSKSALINMYWLKLNKTVCYKQISSLKRKSIKHWIESLHLMPYWKPKIRCQVMLCVSFLSAIHLMFHNFFGQHHERYLIWQLDYHPQYQFLVFAQGPTLQYSCLDGDCDHRRLLFPSHCERPLFLSTESLCDKKNSMTFKYSPVFFNWATRPCARRGWLLGRPRMGQSIRFIQIPWNINASCSVVHWGEKKTNSCSYPRAHTVY